MRTQSLIPQNKLGANPLVRALTSRQGPKPPIISLTSAGRKSAVAASAPFESSLRPFDAEEYSEDLAALEEADGEEINIGHLQKKDIAELNAMAKEMEAEILGTARHEMISRSCANTPENRGTHCRRRAEIPPEGWLPAQPALLNYLPCPEDAACRLRKLRLIGIEQAAGCIRLPKEKEKFFALLMVDKAKEEEPEKARTNPL